MIENIFKQELIWNNLKIQLFESKEASELPYDSESNIIAVDSLGNILWKAEPPITHYEQYFDISIDKNSKTLVANTGSGFRHIINLTNGKILHHYLVK